jgi:long-chain acyl-CoA synthetase
MFTTGTTSQPKGCIITHANLIAAAASVVPHAFKLDNTNWLLSFLPLAHIFEASLHVVGLKVIGRLGFWSGESPRRCSCFGRLQ